MQIRHATHPDDAARLSTDQLRERFLLEDLFEPGEVRLVLTHDDRMVLGGAVPDGGELALEAPEELRAATFCERREVALVNLGEPGAVVVDGEAYEVGHHDVLYVGIGASEVIMSGTGARYYLVSAQASASHPTALMRHEDAVTLHLGEPEQANVRSLRRFIADDGLASDRLVLGITTLAPGSVWNTMPAHTHDRRTEVYLYTDLGSDGRVMHLCGEPSNLRTIVVSDGEAVVSPSWSVHAGSGTQAYSFVWAMSGENRAFTDMDAVPVAELR
ncbi:MAG: 5-dehydro-4-deoxy-D-glucuronate isomerase [Nocardioidaceae bacterium]